jgi:Zn-dependent metalloprotease
MVPVILLAFALGAQPGFEAAFPAAAVVKSPAGDRLTSATRFEAAGLGRTPEKAARAFLQRHGASFGLGARHELRLRSAPPAGTSGAVRFERRIDGRPLFGGDLVVGVDGKGTVVLVNTTDVPPQVSGRFRVGRKAAVAAAAADLAGTVEGRARAERGWRAFGGAVRPVWRVVQVTRDPAGEWQSDVDAATGKVLLRTDLRVTGALRGG